MKSISCTILFTIIVYLSYAQPTIVKNEAVQVLYIGADNPITLRVNQYKPSQLTAKVSIGILTKTSNAGTYNWRICDTKDTIAIIKLYCGKQFIKSFKFPLKRLLNPRFICVGGNVREGGCDIVRAKGVWVGFNDDLTIPKVKCNVVSYHIAVTGGSTLLEGENKGEEFNDEVIAIVHQIKPGNTVVIDKILVQVGCEKNLREVDLIAFNYY